VKLDKPYSPDERRVAEWLNKKGNIGGGEDPIGFLFCSYEFLVSLRNKETSILIRQDRLLCDTARALDEAVEFIDKLDKAKWRMTLAMTTIAFFSFFFGFWVR
jgi:hypothetical protein